MNNQGSRTRSNRYEPIANYYKRRGESLSSDGGKTMENEKMMATATMTATATATATEAKDSEAGEVATMEEDETVSSKLSGEGGSRGETQQWKTVGGNRTQKGSLIEEAAGKANIVGIKMVRIGKTGKTVYGPGDVSNFFKMLRRIDPTAIVLNARKEKTSAKTTKEMEKMNAIDYRGYLDMRSDNWGRPTDNKTKTTWMCYVATDIMTSKLQQLREDEQVQEYLSKGEITLQHTKLLESNSRVAFHIANKDPKYTNRNDLEERLQKHMDKYSEKNIPIHVLDMATSGKNFNIRMCTAVVGGKDLRKVETIFKDHPFKELELIPFTWKFQDNAGYTRRLKEHEGVLKLCRAIKMEEMNVNDELEDFKMLMEADQAYQFVVDIFPASHAERTGVIYVQYIHEHRVAVMGMVQDSIRMIKEKRNEDGEISIVPFINGPKIVNTNGSVAPTIQTTTTEKTTSEIPRSKYGGLLDKNYQVVSATNQVPWAISVNNKSFMEVTTGKVRFQDSDSDMDTSKSGLTSKKSIRETELEEENERLNRQLQEREVQYQQMVKQIQDENKKQRQEDKKQQTRQNGIVQQQIADLQEKERIKDKEHKEYKEQMEKMLADMQTIMGILMKDKGGKEFDETSNKSNQGSTPKRQKKRTVSTPPRTDPKPTVDNMDDEEPTTLEEGQEIK
jgi:hypothetical protein